MPKTAVIASILAYIVLGRLGLDLVMDHVLRSWRPAAAGCCGVAFIAGWIWLIAGMMLGSARDGLLVLRWWVAVMGGLFIAVAPFALLPHPAMALIGAALGFAFAGRVATGKAWWLHRTP